MRSAHLRIENDLSALADIRECVRSFLKSVDGLESTQANRIVLAVDEAAANILEHAAVPDRPLLVELEMTEEADCVRFVLTDNGVVFNPAAAPEVDMNEYASSGAEGGAGLSLVRQIMEVTYRLTQGKNELTLTKRTAAE